MASDEDGEVIIANAGRRGGKTVAGEIGLGIGCFLLWARGENLVLARAHGLIGVGTREWAASFVSRAQLEAQWPVLKEPK